MSTELDLRATGLVAFYFTFREKDLGGIHLGMPPGRAVALLGLLDELAVKPPGHMRRLPLADVPARLPAEITERRGHRGLRELRIASARDAITRVHITGDTGIVELSPRALPLFRSAFERTARVIEDEIVIAGDSGAWNDRLWIWRL